MAASAASTTADLRVEAGSKSLVPPGHSFATNTIKAKTDTRPECGGSGKSVTFDGPNAMGILLDAAKARRALSPVGISDKFSFGLLVCDIGSFMTDTTTFWLFKVDHRFAEVGADQLALTGGEEVLWYRQSGTVNSGAELAIEAPARAKRKRSFEVTVVAYDAAGKKTPAAGAQVDFPGGSVIAGADGRAEVKVSKAGLAKLRAKRGIDIPTGAVEVCIGKKLSDCPAARGKRIFGTAKADELRGTRGPDVIRAGAGKDEIDVRRGGKDKVKCGKGRDSVRIGKGDHAAKDCEIVNGKPRSAGRKK